MIYLVDIHALTVSRIDSGVYDEFLGEFHRTYPRIELHIEVMRSSDIISSLLQKTATAGLGLCRTPVDKLEQRCFLRQRYAIFCGRHHRLFGRHGLSMNDLLAENFVSFTSDQIGDSLSPPTVFRDQRGFTGRIVAASHVDIDLLWHSGRKMNAAEQAFLDGMERTMQRYALPERLAPR